MYILYLLYITIELNTMIIYTHNVYIIFTIYNNRVKYYDNIYTQCIYYIYYI